ncbi:MAG TPA: VacJ family lipoprotein [Gemmatimonadales bacterium]|nr:VacJ family lipoprotein [Gemmatimonadales bacterium]
MRFRPAVCPAWIVFAIGSCILGGCGTLSSSLVNESPLAAVLPSAPSEAPTGSSIVGADESQASAPSEASTGSSIVGADESPASAPSLVISYEPITEANAPPWTVALSGPSRDADDAGPEGSEMEEYDPWERFNEKMFAFNYNMDKYVLKPTAKGYNAIMPDMFQTMIDNAFTNLRMPIRFVNKVLQWRLLDAAKEMGRFLINSTLGIGGLFDVARQEMRLEHQEADFGQTLGIWGIGPGPYLVLPLFPPSTVRDSVGYAVDGSMNILSYYIPFFPEQFGMSALDRVNDRSRNLDLFQGIEAATVDLYSSVRNAYLQRRQRLIKERR